MLGHRQRDALLGAVRQAAVTELRAETRVRAEDGRRAREHADEVGQLTAARERALQDRDAPLGRGELVVYLEPALLGLHRHFTFCARLTARKCRTKRSDRHSIEWYEDRRYADWRARGQAC